VSNLLSYESTVIAESVSTITVHVHCINGDFSFLWASLLVTFHFAEFQLAEFQLG